MSDSKLSPPHQAADDAAKLLAAVTSEVRKVTPIVASAQLPASAPDKVDSPAYSPSRPGSEVANSDEEEGQVSPQGVKPAGSNPVTVENNPVVHNQSNNATHNLQTTESIASVTPAPNAAAEAATRKALGKLRKLKDDAIKGLLPEVKPTEGDEAEAILAQAASDFMRSAENKAAGQEPVRKTTTSNKRDAPARSGDTKRRRSERPQQDFESKVAARADRFGGNARETAQVSRHSSIKERGETGRSGRRSPLPRQSAELSKAISRPAEKTSPRDYNARPVRPSAPPARDDRRVHEARTAYEDRPPFGARPLLDERRPPPGGRTYPDAQPPRREEYGPPGAHRGPPDDRYHPDARPHYPTEDRGYRPPSPPRAAGYRPLSPARSDVSRGPPGGPARRPLSPQAYRDPRGYDAPRDGPYSREYTAPTAAYGPNARRPSSPLLSASLGARIGPPAGEPRYSGAYADPRPAPGGYNAQFRDERLPVRLDARRPYDREPQHGAYTPPPYDDRGPPAGYDRYPPAPPPPLASELDYLKARMAELERLAVASAPLPPPLRERISVGRNTRFNPDGPPAIVSRTYEPVARRDDEPYYGRPGPPPRRSQETRGGR